MQIVDNAIDTSVQTTSTVTIDSIDIARAGVTRDAVQDTLLAECEGSCEENDGSEDFFGSDVDGNEWRVRLA